MTKSSGFSVTGLQAHFDAARAEITGDSLDEIRQNYFIAASMSECDDASVGGLNINKSGRKNSAAMEKNKSRRAIDDVIMMTMMNEALADIEAGMVSKYGEDFAENLAVVVLDIEIYERLMKIEDQEERRRQIAIEINQGIANGTIDPAIMAQYPDHSDWLDARQNVEQQSIKMAASELESDLRSSHNDMDQNTQFEGHTDLSSGFGSVFSSKGPTEI